MNAACADFRTRLARALAAPDPGALGLDAHLATCASCRELLAGEEALELVLASWSGPRLPADLARRVLARLSAAREEDRLDRLLERAPAPAPPPDLARRVLAGLARERRAALRPAWRRPAVLVPALAAAAALVAGIAWWAGEGADGTDGGAGRGRGSQVAAPAEAAEPREAASEGVDLASLPPPGLLAELELLEDWDLLTGDDADAFLGMIDDTELLLLELGGISSEVLGPAPDEGGGEARQPAQAKPAEGKPGDGKKG